MSRNRPKNKCRLLFVLIKELMTMGTNYQQTLLIAAQLTLLNIVETVTSGIKGDFNKLKLFPPSLATCFFCLFFLFFVVM